jgi:hypothetical protein
MRCRCGLGVVSDSLSRRTCTGQPLETPVHGDTIGSLDEEEPMAVAFIQEFAISDRGTANYDAVNKRLTKNQPAPEGLLIHFAGFDDEDGVFRIVNVWETREQGQAYLDEHVMPAVRAVLGDVEWPAPPTRQGFYELHHVAGL